MKTIEDIKYEINFIENEIVNRDFTYLKVDDLKTWLVALNWTLKQGGGQVNKCVGIEGKVCGFEFDPGLEFPNDTLCDECFDQLAEEASNE